MTLQRREAGKRKPISAGAWNFMAEQAERFAARQQGPQIHRTSSAVGSGHTFLDVANESGASRKFGEILGLGNPLRTPTQDSVGFREANALIGASPSLTTHRYKFVVLDEDLVQRQVGQGILTGLCWCKVNINSTVHQYATIKNSDATQLDSYWWGRARLVWSPGTTGSHMCLVELGPYNHGVKYRGKTDGAHNKNSTQTVSVFSGAGVAGSDTTANITDVYNAFADVATTKFVTVAWVNDGPEAIAAEC